MFSLLGIIAALEGEFLPGVSLIPRLSSTDFSVENEVSYLVGAVLPQFTCLLRPLACPGRCECAIIGAQYTITLAFVASEYYGVNSPIVSVVITDPSYQGSESVTVTQVGSFGITPANQLVRLSIDNAIRHEFVVIQLTCAFFFTYCPTIVSL